MMLQAEENDLIIRHEPAGYHRFRTRFVALGFLVASSAFLYRQGDQLAWLDFATLLSLGAWAAALVVYPQVASRLLWLQALLISFLWLDLLWPLLLMVGHCIWLGASQRRWAELFVQYLVALILGLLMANNELWTLEWWSVLLILSLPYPFLYKLFLRQLSPK